MALDALFLSHLANELNTALSAARIDKIHQPERDEIIMNLRAQKGNMRLLISAGSNFPRVNLTEKSYENPQTPPMFCMLLRKHFAGGRIVSVSQPRLERIIDIVVEAADEMGELTRKTISIELMGRYSNIILRDGNDRIIDCLKRIDLEMSEKRQVLPGLFYELPPEQEKLDADALSRADILDLLIESESEQFADKWIISNFLGFSPLTAREAVHRAENMCDIHIAELTLEGKERLASAIYEIASGECSPCIIFDGTKPYAFSYCDITQYDGHYNKERATSLSALLDAFYAKRDSDERIRARAQTILKTVKNAHARTEKKLWIQKNEVQDARKREKYREWGDIITANIYRMQKGDDVLVAQNFFSENAEEIEIPLDLRLTPQQNAAKYYKDYHRMKNAELILTEQIKEGEAELAYLESVLQMLSLAESEQDLVEIREELADGGYLRVLSGKRKTRALSPREFVSSDGFRIYAGRNNRQNDLLTLKTAFKGDIWFHTQKIPGSHVIVECAGEDVPDTTLTEAALIAAYYSRARESQKVPVDYTQVRNVKKPTGAKPGMVIYVNYQTAFVTPDESVIEKLKKKG